VWKNPARAAPTFPQRGNIFSTAWKSWLALLWLGPAAVLANDTLESFAPATAAAWKPYLDSPAVSATDRALAFPTPFTKGNDRFAWDKTIAADLSAAVAFEVDVACPNPEALRALGLYFRSGAGWYVASKPLTRAGPQTLTFAKSDFSTEGQPAGWHKIDGIRLSPWKGARAADTALVFSRLGRVTGSALVVVKPTSSCPDAATRAVAEKTAARVSSLLIEAGIGHRLLTDDEVAKGALSSATVALLPYNPQPGAAELKALQAFLARGGKLGVFYGASPELAAAMGFKLGPYLKAERPDRWRSIVFTDVRGGFLAPRIWQNSTSLMPAYPARADAAVVAAWHNARGVLQPEPAVVISPHGFWMAHILQSDDLPSKRDMLVALCAQMDPGLWAPAARRAVQEAGQINDYPNLAAAVAGIGRQANQAAQPAEIQSLLATATSLSQQAQTALAAGQFTNALLLAKRQRQFLLRGDAAVQLPRRGEFVGVWDHDGTGFVPGDWPTTATTLAAHGVNAIFANVAWGGCAHYPSKYLPASNTLRLYGDQIAAGLAAAQARGLQYHVWLVLGKLDGAPADFVARMKKEGRLQVTDTGVTRPWLSPHHPANRALLLAVVGEIARNYPTIAGIHLDYIRLPDSASCYSATTRARFEADTRKKCAAWPAEVKVGGKRHAEFRKWRTADITALVRDVRSTLRRANPNAKLSAAVYGIAAPDGGNIAQYWPDWLRAGTVDFLVPMNYTESPAEFANWLRTQQSYPGAKGKIIPGIGVTADESRLDPAQVVRQVVLARQAGCPGFVLFALSGTLREETLPALRQGITRPIP
jgi:uncharacterized lipoprotein YddW (UPF0748 family)